MIKSFAKKYFLLEIDTRVRAIGIAYIRNNGITFSLGPIHFSIDISKGK